jgi:hypothetical protein
MSSLPCDSQISPSDGLGMWFPHSLQAVKIMPLIYKNYYFLSIFLITEVRYNKKYTSSVVVTILYRNLQFRKGFHDHPELQQHSQQETFQTNPHQTILYFVLL